MKNLTILVVLVSLLACNSPKSTKTQTNELTSIDSVLQRSKENAIILDEANRKSDTTITGKVEKTVKKMAVMEKQITELKVENTNLKSENNELKENLNDIDDAGKPFNIRSVSND